MIYIKKFENFNKLYEGSFINNYKNWHYDCKKINIK